MSDDELSAEEQLLKRHRKEKKDLQAKIQNLKKTLSKGDKKKKKEAQEEINQLENDLSKRHAKELESLKEDLIVSDTTKLAERLILDESKTDVTNVSDNSSKQASKAQKRRDKKEQQEKERQANIEAQKEMNKLGPRHLETTKIVEILKDRNLALYDIPSNGDCLFAAVCHQIPEKDVPQLRRECVENIKTLKDEYLPFLTHPKTGEMLTDAQFVEYCSNMAETNAWGGQVELRAISDILHRKIEVLQSEGPPIIIGENESSDQLPIMLTYHRHYLGLGEHYNSIKPCILHESDDCDD